METDVPPPPPHPECLCKSNAGVGFYVNKWCEDAKFLQLQSGRGFSTKSRGVVWEERGEFLPSWLMMGGQVGVCAVGRGTRVLGRVSGCCLGMSRSASPIARLGVHGAAWCRLA